MGGWILFKNGHYTVLESQVKKSATQKAARFYELSSKNCLSLDDKNIDVWHIWSSKEKRKIASGGDK